VEPVEAINDIKRVTLMDFAKKRRQLRYEIKKAMKLKEMITYHLWSRGRENIEFSMQKTSKSKLIGGCPWMIRFFLTYAKR
jgi:hypothetical protein